MKYSEILNEARLSKQQKEKLEIQRKMAWQREHEAIEKANKVVSNFRKELNTDHIKTQDLGNNYVWNYIETPKGKSTATVKDAYPLSAVPTAEIFWLLAADRGAGREALKLICDLADKHGVYLQGEAIPLEGKQGNEKFRLTLEQLLKFYTSFGFEIKPNKSSKYPLIVRKPNPIKIEHE